MTMTAATIATTTITVALAIAMAAEIFALRNESREKHSRERHAGGWWWC
jgi:hypothetical protein